MPGKIVLANGGWLVGLVGSGFNSGKKPVNVHHILWSIAPVLFDMLKV